MLEANLATFGRLRARNREDGTPRMTCADEVGSWHWPLQSATCRPQNKASSLPAQVFAMNQLELKAQRTHDNTQSHGAFHPAKSMKGDADATPPNNTESAAASAQFKRFPPPLPLGLSEKRRLQSTVGIKQENPEVDHDDNEQGNQGELYVRRESATCEPMVRYDGFDSVGIPKLTFGDDGDEDVVNFRSPIVCKPSSVGSSSWSPKCVSAVTHNESDPTNTLKEPSWSIQEFQQYLGMLELLQEACGNSEGEEVSLSANSLGQMERLLTALLPSKV